jgi:GH18 family chitinase
LVIGIPCNGHLFHSNHITIKENVSLDAVRIPFKDILKLAAQGWKNSWEKDAYAPLLFSPNEKDYITYDSLQTAQLKGQWARQQGYRGVFFSDITQDAVNKDNLLAHAARSGYAGTK